MRRDGWLIVAATVGWTALTAWALFRPTAPSADESLVGHLVAFSALASLFSTGRRWPVRLATALALVTLGLAAEAAQPLVGRAAERQDAIANGIGVTAGLAVGLAADLLFRRPRLARRVVAGSALLLLLPAALVVHLGFGEIALRWTCRSVDTEPIEVDVETPWPVQTGDDTIALRCLAFDGAGLTIRAVVTPDTVEVGGPMRIVTASTSTVFRDIDLHVGQEEGALSIRSRGRDDLEWILIDDVFEAGVTTEIEVRLSPDRIVAVVDGEVRYDEPIESFDPVEWDDTNPLLVGDELGGGRLYEGTIESVTITGGAAD